MADELKSHHVALFAAENAASNAQKTQPTGMVYTEISVIRHDYRIVCGMPDIKTWLHPGFGLRRSPVHLPSRRQKARRTLIYSHEWPVRGFTRRESFACGMARPLPASSETSHRTLQVYTGAGAIPGMTQKEQADNILHIITYDIPVYDHIIRRSSTSFL